MKKQYEKAVPLPYEKRENDKKGKDDGDKREKKSK